MSSIFDAHNNIWTSSKDTIIGQTLRVCEENVAKVVGATSSESILVEVFSRCHFVLERRKRLCVSMITF